MHRKLLLLACAAAMGMLLALATDAAADQTALCAAPARAAIQLADATSGGDKLLACCFEGSTDERCDFSSPNQTGCEWKLTYQCPETKYTCDADAKVCVCDAPIEGAAPAP
jgi:hypothetical protein